MNVLVVGGGGREHALVWSLSKSPSVTEVVCAPGNAGTAELCENASVAADDVAGLCQLARARRFDLVVVGPEKPLTLGLADALALCGIPVFGCSRGAAEIEGSKAFSKSLMVTAGVPTARYGAFIGTGTGTGTGTGPGIGNDVAAARAFAVACLARHGRVVVKADGLAAGKGVAICDDAVSAGAAIERFCRNGGAVVVEEFLAGHEASCMALVDGEHVHMLPACEDHKTVFDGDLGPMTGGMGAISPTPVVDAALLARVEREILVPTARALVAVGRPFRGLLYAGVIATSDGPKVLEFNCRLGDPEAEALLHRFRGDLAEALLAVALGEGRTPALAFAPGSACSVVLCARGYPGTAEKGAEITGIDAARATGAEVFHAGTRRVSGRLLVDGGRVLAVTASGDDLPQARTRAYAAAALIHFDGKHHRGDIGARPRR